MKKSAASLISALLLAGGTLTVKAGSPGIVVGIVVDQLRTDYLEQLRPYFGDKGFNRLITEGVYIPDVDFHNSVKDAPSGAAVVYTGAWPSFNGVVSAEILDRNQLLKIPVLTSGSGRSREYSPENIRLSTLADEFAVSNGKLSKIYSVSSDPQVSVVTAGHAGNSAIAPDMLTGRWASPSYYGSLPPAVANKNHTSPLSSRLAGASWRPLHPASYYDGANWTGDFNYGFGASGRDGYARYIESAPFNSEITEIALDLIKTAQTGTTGQPGMINIEYSLAPYSFDSDDDGRAELVDSYMRLDAELARLFEAIDKSYGIDNAVIFLSSTGYAAEPALPEAAARIPEGEVSLKKAESLLNAYLSATHGNGDYVAIIDNGKLYLDAKEIERKGIDISKIRSEAKLFLLRMEGVSYVLSLEDILSSGSERARELSLTLDYKNQPDLFLFFTPGWTVTDDNAYPVTSEKIRLSAPSTPAFILAPDIESQRVESAVDATVLAPTVSSILRIRAPNGASAKPLNLKTKNR